MVEHLQADVLKANISETFNLELDVVVHTSIDSTSNWALQQCRAGKVLPFVCFAENQTSGKGRRGKQWLMSAYSNIAMSLSWPYVLSGQQLQLLPLTVALAVAKTLENLNLEHVQIKWPNDVYVRGKKIAGILIETRPIKQKLSDGGSEDSSQTAVVIGVGLNYDMSSSGTITGSEGTQMLPDLTDIKHEIAGQEVEPQPGRKSVASLLLQNVVSACRGFQQDSVQNLEEFRTRYDYCKNKTVEIFPDNQDALTGVAQGVNDSAELLVLVDGKMRVFNSAEVSVKAETR